MQISVDYVEYLPPYYKVDYIFHFIITDETFVHHNTPEIKQQSENRISSCKK